VAGKLKLFESPDFRDLLLAAADHFQDTGLNAQLIEKDYYVTEVLRLIANQWSEQVVFKGGTSLSKGWKLINRFSEDLDLFLLRNTSTPLLSKNQVDKTLKEIEAVVAQLPGFRYLPGSEQSRSRSERGISRTSDFEYDARFPGIGAIQNRVLLEVGIRSGDYPLKTVDLSSFVADFLQARGESLEAEDEKAFSMTLLDYRRTFVEKLFGIHSKILQCQQNGTPFDTYTRHYYDLFCLAQTAEVKAMLKSEEYSDIKRDCDRISREYFQNSYSPIVDLRFSESVALFPTGELRQLIAKAYTSQCQILCFGSAPTWAEVEQCFETLKAWL
jgi:hypothetical protein